MNAILGILPLLPRGERRIAYFDGCGVSRNRTGDFLHCGPNHYAITTMFVFVYYAAYTFGKNAPNEQKRSLPNRLIGYRRSL